MSASIALTAAAVSYQGRRPNNEDCVLSEPQAGVFAVIDGIGGGPHGEEAAAIALGVLRERLLRSDAPPERRLREAVALANNEIFRRTQSRPDMRGSGCVLVAAIIESGIATIAHVGDARAYLLRPGSICRLTMDHSLTGELERHGGLSEEQALQAPGRHQVYRQVGGAVRDLDDPGFIEVNAAAFGEDAALLLCSDGLSDALFSQDIRAIVEGSEAGPARTADHLVEAAFDRGSGDNISAVYIEGATYRSAPPSPVPTPSPARPKRVLRVLLLAVLVLTIAWQNRSQFQRPAADQEGPHVWRVSAAEHQTISEALDRSKPGDTVLVGPGRYDESIQIRPGVRLIAEPRRQAVIGGSQPVAVMALRASNAHLDGFRIAGDGRLLIGLLAGDSVVEMEDVEITGAQFSGVQWMGASRGIMLHCVVHHNAGAGLRILDSAAPEVTESVFAANGQAPEIAAGSSVEVTGSAFLDPVKDRSLVERFRDSNFFPLLGDASHVRRTIPGRIPPGRTDQ